MNIQEMYLFADIARLNAEVAGMQAENAERARHDMAPAYGEDAFVAAIERNGLGHNQVIERVRAAQ